MSETEIKNCDNETVKTDKEQLKKDLTEFINKNKDKLDKSIIRIIEKFVNDESVNQSELVYLFLNIFMGGEEMNELKLLILNSKPQDISTPMQQHLEPYNPTEAAKFQQMQELVNIDKDSPDYRRLMEERLLKDMQNIQFQKTNITLAETYEDNQEPEITDNVKEDIHNKFCTVQGFEKEINKRVNDKFFQTIDYEPLPEEETDIQRANDPKFTLKVIAIMIIVLFLSLFVIGFCAMFG